MGRIAAGCLLSVGLLAAPRSTLAAAGDLDPTFGIDGRVTTTIGPFGGVAKAAVLLPDGRIVAAGFAAFDAPRYTDFALARYNPDGSLDPSFGAGTGTVTTDFFSVLGGDHGFDVALQADGKLVAVGPSFVSPGRTEFALARYNADGSLDTTFGSGTGRVTVVTSSGCCAAGAYGIALQPDGKIIVVGTTVGATELDFAVARLNPDGSLDSTFGGGTGVIVTDFGLRTEGAADVVLQPDGRIVVAGVSSDVGSSRAALARYNPNGTLDPTFGGGSGKVIFEGMPGGWVSVVLQPGGEIVVTGGYSDFALARFTTDGSLDPTFGGGTGVVFTDFGGTNDVAADVALQPDGRLVAVGYSEDGGAYHFAVARYNADGGLDPSFGDGTGRVVTDFADRESFGNAVVLPSDDKILVVGEVQPTPSAFALARYCGRSDDLDCNLPPSCASAVSSRDTLWPPDHTFASVSVLGVTDPDGDPITVTITSIQQDEPVLGVGDGNTAPDGGGVGTDTASVRAERAGTPKLPGDGRVYRIGFTADDGRGGECSGNVTVCVPHDQRPDQACVDGGPLYDSTATSDAACGLGFELVLVLPGMIWLFRRRGRLAA